MATNQKTPVRDRETVAGRRSASAERSSSKTSGMGRGWHGDSEGHAKAGRQSNKNK